MYDAKRHGNGVSVYRDQLGLDSPDSFALLSDFRAALVSGDRDQLSMHYQPQVNINTGTVEGLEALLRWRHPVRGPIDTATIIGLAEHSTVMHLLTQRVIDNVTTRLAGWHEEGLNPRVAINVSARDLYSQSIVTHLKRRLDEFQLPSHQFQIEVTESALVADPARAGIILRRISDLGIDISLDDFGTGYSSLQYLRQMPLNEIKVDQSFVSCMTRHRDDASIVSSTIELAHSLGLRTVAEGVEDQPTLQLLGQLGCDLGQGYHISRAVPEDKVPDLIVNRLGRAA
jgi:EAL domain-containing protein (putative c-di-GMP-specific phosphodiesterase class I)